MIAKINNIEIHYQVTGSGMPILLIHGHPFDYTMWNPQITALAASYTVIAPDLRGYGKSSVAKSTTKFEDYATDMLLLMDHLKIHNFHLAGLSMGGQIIMEMFRQAPGRIKSMIFADTFASPDSPEVKQGRYDAAARVEQEGMDKYADEMMLKLFKRENLSIMPDAVAFVTNMVKASSPAGSAMALRARAERINYLAQVLPNINIPTLVIVGRDDEFTPVAKAEELKHSLQNCKLVIIEDAGHMPNLEQANQFNTAIIAFLGGISNYMGGSF